MDAVARELGDAFFTSGHAVGIVERLDVALPVGRCPGLSGLAVGLHVVDPFLGRDQSTCIVAADRDAFSTDGRTILGHGHGAFVGMEEKCAEPVGGSAALNDRAGLAADDIVLRKGGFEGGDVVLARPGNAGHLLQLHAAHCGGDLGDAVVDAKEEVARLVGVEGLSAVGEALGVPVEFLVVGGDHSALAGRGGVLAGHHAEAAHITYRAHRLALILRVVRLRTVLDYVQIMVLGDIEYFVHIAGMSGDMAADDGFGLVGDESLNGCGVHVEIVFVAVGENGDAVVPQDGHDSAGVGNRRADDLTAGIEAQGTESRVNCGGA